MSRTRWAYALAISRFGETKTASTRNAEDVAAGRDHGLVGAQGTTLEVVAEQGGIHCTVPPLVDGFVLEYR